MALLRVHVGGQEDARREAAPLRTGDGQVPPGRERSRIDPGGREVRQRSGLRAVEAAQARGAGRVGVARELDEGPRPGGEQRAVPAPAGGQLPGRDLAGERDGEEVALGGAEPRGAEGAAEDLFLPGAEADRLGDRPFVGAEADRGIPRSGIAVEAAPAVPVRPPEEAAVGEKAELVAEVHPGGPLLGETDLARAVGVRAEEEIEAILAAIEALDGERAAVGRPVRPDEVGVGTVVGPEPPDLARGEIDDADLHRGVRPAGVRITLPAQRGVRLAVSEQRVLADAPAVEPVEGDRAAIRTPPEAGGVPVPDLLPVDPVGGAVEDLVRHAVGGERLLPAGREIEQVEVRLANVGKPVTLR
ncbi:MAG: hypothetical protein BWX64_02610 [Acidobacteria bacterium ADurb.Bin051]|nr:MAG: hypothetical protein BWX64_02610 [Acidobacteria bacterium ADurb.Bin051]